jgi:hypothetical protein
VALILGLLLAACAPAGPAGPQRITLLIFAFSK